MLSTAMRLFIAIELPPAVHKYLARVQELLRPELPAVAWTPPDNLHITLKFLGQVPDLDVPAVCAALDSIPAKPSMHLRASGMLCFPPRRPLRILGVSMAGDVEPLIALARDIDQCCGHLGFEPERRRFQPHVTLGRARGTVPGFMRPLMDQLTTDLWPGPQFAIDHFVLMQSTLKKDGAQYAVARRFPLSPQLP
jgi:2'-5' RNA ligase